MTCLLFCEHLGTLLAEKIFCLDIFAFVIIKKILTFSSFFSQSLFFMIWLQLFLKNLISDFSSH